MSALLPSATHCCNTCEEEVTVAVPGPGGSDGADGAPGEDGVSAFTTTTAQFTMPAELANVTITVATSEPFAVGQTIYIKSGGASGYFQVVSKPSSTSIEIKNLKDTTTSAYLGNSVAGTVFATLALVVPGGVQGPSGTNGTNGTNLAAYTGNGTPEGVVTADRGSTYWDYTNLIFYVKHGASGNTGWRELIA